MAISRGSARIVIYDNVIRAQFTGKGIVKQEVDRVGRRASALARAYAPARTGTLKASIKVALNGSPGRYGASFTVYADTRYANWVEEGTRQDGKGEITPRAGGWLRLPRFTMGATPYARLRASKRGTKSKGGVSLFIYRRVVSGQRGQHYVRNGARDALWESGYGKI